MTDQTPGGGAIVPNNASIVLYLGVEKPNAPSTVPNVVGKTPAEANKALTNAGLIMKVTGATSTGRQHRQRHRHFPERGGGDGIGCRQRGHGAFRRENHGLTAPYRTFCQVYDTIFGMLSGKTCYNSQGVLCIQPPTAL